jgi:surface polysaccharide O-acyltransferase-like enzyme
MIVRLEIQLKFDRVSKYCKPLFLRPSGYLFFYGAEHGI